MEQITRSLITMVQILFIRQILRSLIQLVTAVLMPALLTELLHGHGKYLHPLSVVAGKKFDKN